MIRRLTLALVLATGAIAASADAAPINTRQARQDARVGAGIAQGQLTRCEAQRLDARGNRIQAREQAYRSTAGLQPWERADLQRRLNATSADIAEQRRDGNGCY
jgi:hypothetical protein